MTHPTNEYYRLQHFQYAAGKEYHIIEILITKTENSGNIQQIYTFYNYTWDLNVAHIASVYHSYLTAPVMRGVQWCFIATRA